MLKANDYATGTQKIFAFLKVKGEQQVIGSASLQDNLYTADYDLQEHITSADINHYDVVYRIFKEKFDIAERRKDIYITDFKCGLDKHNNPLRWNKHTILQKKKFIDALQQESTIKMDVIALIYGVFHEFSENYYLSIHGKSNIPPLSKQDVLFSLKQEMQELYREKNYWKALKRLFAFSRLKPLSKMTALLQSFFNTTTGYLQQNVSELGILSQALDFKAKNTDICNNLQLIKQNVNRLSAVHSYHVSNHIDIICKEKSKKKQQTQIDALAGTLSKIVQQNALEFIKKHPRLVPYLT